jgi:hypothetical protein
VFLKPYILKVSFWLLLGVIKDIRKIAFKQDIFKDNTANCGGGWYISQNLEYKRKLDLERSNIETMWFEIKPCHNRSFLL